MEVTVPGLTQVPLGSSYEAFGCAVNQVSVEELFAKYEECGFLYRAKRERLGPYWPRVVENWRKSMRAGSSRIHDVIVYADAETGAWASVTMWATTNVTVHSQHLVSVGRPEASRAVLLSAQSDLLASKIAASQNWFRAENRYPARVFGSCTHSIGPENAVVADCACVAVQRPKTGGGSGGVSVHRCSDADCGAVHRLASRLSGHVQARADEWEMGDIELAALDERYREVGLRRYRRVFIATAPGIPEPIGFAVAYRGPLGLSFSFLENRCEVWVDPQVDDGRLRDATDALLHAAGEVYEDFELPYMVVVTDACTAQDLVERGAQALQSYRRSIWLWDGFPAWYSHVNGFYSRVLAAAQRRGNGGR